MEIKIAPEKFNNETAPITLPGRNTIGFWLSKKINLRRCADLHNWYGCKMDMRRTELSTHREAEEEFDLCWEMRNRARALQSQCPANAQCVWNRGEGSSACAPAWEASGDGDALKGIHSTPQWAPRGGHKLAVSWCCLITVSTLGVMQFPIPLTDWKSTLWCPFY